MSALPDSSNGLRSPSSLRWETLTTGGTPAGGIPYRPDHRLRTHSQLPTGTLAHSLTRASSSPCREGRRSRVVSAMRGQ